MASVLDQLINDYGDAILATPLRRLRSKEMNHIFLLLIDQLPGLVKPEMAEMMLARLTRGQHLWHTFLSEAPKDKSLYAGFNYV